MHHVLHTINQINQMLSRIENVNIKRKENDIIKNIWGNKKKDIYHIKRYNINDKLIKKQKIIDT